MKMFKGNPDANKRPSRPNSADAVLGRNLPVKTYGNNAPLKGRKEVATGTNNMGKNKLPK